MSRKIHFLKVFYFNITHKTWKITTETFSTLDKRLCWCITHYCMYFYNNPSLTNYKPFLKVFTLFYKFIQKNIYIRCSFFAVGGTNVSTSWKNPKIGQNLSEFDLTTEVHQNLTVSIKNYLALISSITWSLMWK